MIPPTITGKENTGMQERWQLKAACTAGLLAMLAGVIGLLAEQQSNLAIRNQIHATSEWSHYQAKSIRKQILESRIELLNEVGKPAPQDLLKRMSEYDRDKEELATEAWNAQNETQRCIKTHDLFSMGLTLFHVAIALATLSLMTRRRFFWIASLLFGATGCIQLLVGLLLP